MAPAFRIEARDEAAFSTSRICPITHNYHEHPLMRLERLEELAHFLRPRGGLRFIQPGTTRSSVFGPMLDDPDGRDIKEVFRRIEEPGSWIALYNVEHDPEYRDFLQQAVGTVRHLIERQEPGIFNMFGYLFISAAPSITPMHIDRENNLWLQVRGRKIMTVWDRDDRAIVPARDLEDFMFNGALENVKYRDEYAALGHEFDVGPGDGVYFPSTSPHATRCERGASDDPVSISIGVVFYTSVTRYRANVLAANKVLRAAGMDPAVPGDSQWADRLKYPLGKAVTLLNRHVRRRPMPPGF